MPTGRYFSPRPGGVRSPSADRRRSRRRISSHNRSCFTVATNAHATVPKTEAPATWGAMLSARTNRVAAIPLLYRHSTTLSNTSIACGSRGRWVRKPQPHRMGREANAYWTCRNSHCSGFQRHRCKFVKIVLWDFTRGYLTIRPGCLPFAPPPNPPDNLNGTN